MELLGNREEVAQVAELDFHTQSIWEIGFQDIGHWSADAVLWRRWVIRGLFHPSFGKGRRNTGKGKLPKRLRPVRQRGESQRQVGPEGEERVGEESAQIVVAPRQHARCQRLCRPISLRTSRLQRPSPNVAALLSLAGGAEEPTEAPRRGGASGSCCPGSLSPWAATGRSLPLPTPGLPSMHQPPGT
jgi:hypothetical protein